MSLLPNAGVLAPVPDSFDFDAQVLAPAPRDPTGRTLRMRNQHNLTTEKFNEISVEQTLNCKEDRANYVDVGPPLKTFYAYTQDDMTDMIYSEQYCGDVGPLPVFIRQQVNRSRRIRAERADTEKVEKEKVKGRPVHGSMVLSNPITRLPGQRAAVTIPNVIRHSMAEGLYIPLHWFSDERLQFIQHRLHDVPTKLFRPEPSLEFPSPDKVLVFDMPKMILMSTWGSDESSACLSPLKWQQAATNMEAALTIVSEVVPSNAPDKATYASEFRKHRLFFTNYDKFEDNYADWYPFEREARHQILQGFIFDGNYYVRQVDGLLHAKQAAVVYGTSSADRKRSWDREPETPSRPPKAPRQMNDSPGSFRGTNHLLGQTVLPFATILTQLADQAVFPATLCGFLGPLDIDAALRMLGYYLYTWMPTQQHCG
ncbi:hypothetical protein B0H10DRAFT_2197417 [Mycena sp. CBHHK59/15]|nr:hypothetical protein B0H10DRAFT_2197417 [Mycena sp. CBHHK59/15]